MAPLFSALVIGPGAVLLLALAFAVARSFQPVSVAILTLCSLLGQPSVALPPLSGLHSW